MVFYIKNGKKQGNLNLSADVYFFVVVDYDFPMNSQNILRENAKYYIPTTPDEQREMLKYCGYKNFEEMYSFLKENNTLHEFWDIGEALPPKELKEHLENLSKKNKIYTSFLSHGLPHLSDSKISEYLGGLRKLCTAYTPYQPELGQGTLIGLQIYSSMLQLLTGMEAINASLYDRASAMYEAIATSIRIHKNKKNTALVLHSAYDSDIWTIKSNARHTKTKIETIELDESIGKISVSRVNSWLEKNHEDCACILIPQVNCLGVVEDFDALVDICKKFQVTPVAVIDPMHLFPGPNSLKKPRFWGSDSSGVPIMVGEGQHLCISPNYGGPGLGIFAVQYNENDKQTIRNMPGRLVGKAKDVDGRDCFTLIMSTREQHIRREKATSNICSNQSYLALMAGANLLEKGYLGLANTLSKACHWAQEFSTLCLKNEKEKKENFPFSLKYPSQKFMHEVVLSLKNPNAGSSKEWIAKAQKKKIHLGVISSDAQNIVIGFSDRHELKDIQELCTFLGFDYLNNLNPFIPLQENSSESNLWPKYDLESLKNYYNKLNELNLSPDDGIYPLGSCTMKYNPLINEYAANLSGFTQLHPDVPVEDAQGTLQILFEIQEKFKKITNLPHVTNLPVAGAQGELVGLKIFQKYFEFHGELNQRKYLLIPKSAHGTNPASAAVANLSDHLIIIQANSQGRMDLAQIEQVVQQYGKEIFGIMVTNPNTSGIFEVDFKKMANLIHGVGGLVYMDGANMNAIAGWADLSALGVDAVHNNLHKTWSIPHGGGGPGDAIVAVSEKLKDFLPAHQVIFNEKSKLYEFVTPTHSIGVTHRHFGNVAHKIRCYTYLMALGTDGVKTMSAMATLSSQYLLKKIQEKISIPLLPENTSDIPRMHEFILTLSESLFDKLQAFGFNKNQIIPQIGKLFLDFKVHAPTVAFPEPLGLMIEPTESFTKTELDNFVLLIQKIFKIVEENPQELKTAPHNTPIRKIDELSANKQVDFSWDLRRLPFNE